MARRSTSELEAHVGYWLRFVSNHVSHAFKRKVEARGVTVAEWVVLRELFGSGSVAPSVVAENLGLTRGAVSKLVERLVAKSLVERTQADGDQRYQVVALTPAGKRLVPTLAALADANDAEFFGHWSAAQRREAIELLRELVQRHGWKNAPTE